MTTRYFVILNDVTTGEVVDLEPADAQAHVNGMGPGHALQPDQAIREFVVAESPPAPSAD